MSFALHGDELIHVFRLISVWAEDFIISSMDYKNIFYVRDINPHHMLQIHFFMLLAFLKKFILNAISPAIILLDTPFLSKLI